MHRLLCALTLAVAPVTAQAETGPPTAEEVATARAACKAEVRQDCLLTLALDAALAEERPDERSNLLSQIATLRARAGDVAAADRTLSLAKADEFTLLELGRWDQAYSVAKRSFSSLTDEHRLAEGVFKSQMVQQMLDRGEVDLALKTALSVPSEEEMDKALLLIHDHYIRAKDFASAMSIQAQIKASEVRSQVFLALLEAQLVAGLMTDASATLENAEDAEAEARGRLAMAKALLTSGSIDAAKAQFDTVLGSANGRLLKTPDWGLPVLINSANLALSSGEIAIAKQHADAAFELLERRRLAPLKQSYLDSLSWVALHRFAQLLQRVGSEDSAVVLFAETALRPSQPETVDQKAARLAEQYVWDRSSYDGTNWPGDILRQLKLLAEENPESHATERLADAAVSLVDLGIRGDAEEIANDLLWLPNGESAASRVYLALLFDDPSRAESYFFFYMRNKNSLAIDIAIAWARSLDASEDNAHAKTTLVNLRIGIEKGDRTASEWMDDWSKIAKTLEILGFPGDSAGMRRAGLDSIGKADLPSDRAKALLSLSESFP